MQVTSQLDSFLFAREIGIKLPLPVDYLIQEHIRNDNCLKHDFPLPEKTIAFGRMDRVIMYSSRCKTSVYDIVGRKVLFSGFVNIPEDQSIKRYIFSENGLMLMIVGETYNRSIRFVKNGVEIGVIDFDGEELNLEDAFILHDKVVLRWSEAWNITYDVCDHFGRLKKRISTSAFNENNRYIATSNDQFDILISSTDVGRRQTTANLFILDLITEQKRKFELESHEDTIQISAAMIYKNTLVYGMTYLKDTGRWIKTDMNPKVVEVDIMTGQIEKTHHLEGKENNRIKKILVNGDHIVILIKNPFSYKNYIQIIERQNGNHKIISLDGYSDHIGLSFVSEWLMVSGSATYQFYDLRSDTIIKSKSVNAGHLSFQEGRLVHLDKAQAVVHIEDYN